MVPYTVLILKRINLQVHNTLLIYSATYHLYMWNRSNIEYRAKNTTGRKKKFRNEI